MGLVKLPRGFDLCRIWFVVLPLALGWGIQNSMGVEVKATTPQQFWSAFFDKSVDVIQISAPIILPPPPNFQQSNLTRNLTIIGDKDLYPKLSFIAPQVGRLTLDPGVVLKFEHLAINGTFTYGPNNMIYPLGRIIGYSPSAVLILNDCMVHAPACPHITNEIVQIVANFMKRTDFCPAQQQDVLVQANYCYSRKCWSNAIVHNNLCFVREDIFQQNGAMVQEGGYLHLLCGRTVYLCDTTTPFCSASGCAASQAARSIAPGPQQSAKHNEVVEQLPAIIVSSLVVLLLLGAGVTCLVMRRRLQPLWRRITGSSDHGSSAESVDTDAIGHKRGLSLQDIHPTVVVTGGPSVARSASPCKTPPLLHPVDDVEHSSASLLPSSTQDVQLGSMIGRGSYGSVYQGTWRGQMVAVKVVEHTPASLRHIHNEIKLITSLRHPNVTKALHVLHTLSGRGPSSSLSSEPPSLMQTPRRSAEERQSTSSGPMQEASSGTLMETWIVMELCDLGSLEAMIQSGQFAQGNVLRLHPLLLRLRDVAAGMAHIQRFNVCHGDLKAGNILCATAPLDPYGCTAKVADFGLSRSLSAAQTYLSTRTMGTLSHMPPELLLKGQLGCPGDVYSFGILMYEIATGQPPFVNLAIGELVRRVVVENERPILPSHLPHCYLELAESCWAPDKTARPTFEEVVARLDDMIRDSPQLQQEMSSKVHSLLHELGL